MAVRLTCPLGHAWEENAILPERAARCPVCGIIVPWPPDGIVPTSSSREDAGPTVMQSTDWHAGAGNVNEAPPSLADFEILGELGRGGMGMVYKARWRSQNRIVALKIIRQDRLQHDEAVRRFRREAQAAARLHHPNIVQVFDSDHSGDTHYLVMEYVDGVTLDRLVEEKGALPIPQACDYIRQAAYGLQHAHEQALVHRDIKPANLMVVSGGVVSGDNPKGSKTRPGASDSPTHQAPSTKHQTPLTIGPLTTHQIKILDMGVARVLHLTGGGSSGESLSTLTQGGAVIGTADFIAPEQLEDPHGADIRADLYSLGCTFYFLLTGHVPFPGGSLVSKLDKQRWQAPTPVDELRLDIPVAVAGVVRKLLAKKPADRFRTPGELAHALEELAQGGYTDAARARLTIEEARRLAGPTSAEAAVAIAANGSLAVSGGKDRVLRLWDMTSGELVRSLAKQTQEIRALAFAPQGDRFAAATGVAVRLWDPATGQELCRLGGHTDAVRGVAFIDNGDRLVSAAEDKSVRVWDIRTCREVQRMARHTAGVTCCAAARDGSVAVSGGRDQTLRVWDPRTGQELQVLAPNAGTVLAVDLTPDARLAASAHFDTLVRLWDVQAGRELRRFQGHKQMVTAVLCTPDGKHLVTGSQDQTMRLWRIDSGLELANASLGSGVLSLAVGPSGNQVLAALADRTLRVLRLPLS